MARIAASLLGLALVAGCTRAPAPVDATTTPTSPEPASAPASGPAYTVADAPASTSRVNGIPCAAGMETGALPQFLPDSPVGVVAHFYEKVLVGKGNGGAPDAAQLETWRPHLSVALVGSLGRAAAERDAAIAAHPGEKPPYAEGALFVSLFEGYTQAQPLTVATEGDNARVPVCFAYADASGRTEWTDTVVLRKEDGAWRIDDVVYGGQWDFANTGSLRNSLPAEK